MAAYSKLTIPPKEAERGDSSVASQNLADALSQRCPTTIASLFSTMASGSGLDDGFFPWDYYPYYAYDYYPYDYYPGYYADSEPYYYDEGVYSSTPMQDPTVSAIQAQLTRLGYYNGPVGGIFGPTTRDAVAKYQIAKQLDVTGSLSPDTLQSIGLPQANPS